MDEIASDFYVTLPSNSSMNFFPENTQGKFRTKLSKAIALIGSWEVGVSEIVIPKNWFNITDVNNGYIITQISEESVTTNRLEYKIPILTESNIFTIINQNIEKATKSQPVKFNLNDLQHIVQIEIEDGYEVIIDNDSNKLLYMLNLPNKAITIKETSSFEYRPTSVNLDGQFFTIKKSSSVENDDSSFIISMTEEQKFGNIFERLNENIFQILKEKVIEFKKIKNEVLLIISKDVEIYLDSKTCPKFMKFLSIFSDNQVITESYEFIYKEVKEKFEDEFFMLVLKPVTTINTKKAEQFMKINNGFYKLPAELFREFHFITFDFLPSGKVALYVSNDIEVEFSAGLRDLLGFKQSSFKQGYFTSDYRLELDAGISEIYVYSDIVESHHVGDTIAPVLRVIPVLSESNDKIVKNYPMPLYFPLRKTYFDTIQIDLRSSTGEEIIFTGGKSLLVLSFRRKRL